MKSLLNMTDLINSVVLAMVEKRTVGKELINVILNLLEMKVAQEPDKLKSLI